VTEPVDYEALAGDRPTRMTVAVLKRKTRAALLKLAEGERVG